MKTLKRALSALLTATAALRLSNVRAWELPAGLASVGLGILRLALVFRDIARGELPWQRALLPAALLVPWSWTILYGGQRRSMHLLLAVVETVALALLVGIWRSPGATGELPERRLAKGLSLFLPPLAARWAAVEMVVLSAAFRWPFQRLPQGPLCFGYSQNSFLFYLPLAIVLEMPIEYLLVKHAFGLQSLLWHAVLLATNAWGLMWFLGLLSTMRMRPHQLKNGTLYLYKGILAQAEIPMQHLEAIGRCNDGHKPPRTAMLTLPGVDTIELQLRQPVTITRLFGRPVVSDRLWISVEQPEIFRNALAL